MKNLPKPVLAGNWKMNLGPSAAAGFVAEFLRRYSPSDDQTVLLFPSALSLAAVRQALGNHAGIRLGVQNVFWESAGAFTGEISAPMATEAGAEFVLIGHSERRHQFGETIPDTERKVRATRSAGLLPLLCVGETLEERRAGRAEQVVAEQLDSILALFETDHPPDLVLAYEPVWAIGTGETATPADANSLHHAIRQQLTSRFGAEGAQSVPVLYGGSVKPENAAELLQQPEIDGVLVGGASLDPATFAAICESAT